VAFVLPDSRRCIAISFFNAVYTPPRVYLYKISSSLCDHCYKSGKRTSSMSKDCDRHACKSTFCIGLGFSYHITQACVCNGERETRTSELC
jgi:hypothetical protein